MTRGVPGVVTVTVLGICVLSVMAPALATTPSSRPNIVLIMADDMGYECVGANGGTSYRTPALDQLATQGMRFTNCHSQPLCTPSRVQLMTGLYNHRNYIRFGILDPQATTFSQLLRKSGYRTCIAGKWQLLGGFDGPDRCGFDEYRLWQLTVRKSRYPNPVLEEAGKIVASTGGEYGPALAVDFICDFMERNREKPFLVYYPMILPHWPFEPTPDSAEWDPAAGGVQKGHGDTRFFADMVAYTDKMVGRIIGKLDKLELRENTLVLFTCDNGTAIGITSRMGEREVPGGKSLMTDAGTHVPFIASWPGTIPAARVCDDLVDFSDFMPTVLGAAGMTIPTDLALDGRSFLPQLRGETGRPREWIYCWYARDGGPTGRQFARTKRFKLYGDARFYDISADWPEQRDLSPTVLGGEAAAAHGLLEKALARYRGTRTIRSTLSPAENAVLAKAAEGVKALGGHVFWKDGALVEVVLNNSTVRDEDLDVVEDFADLTDLSLEGTRVGDAGIARLRGLRRLEWLNLYRTQVGNSGLEHLGRLKTLKHLPIGETRVTDEGLRHLEKMTQLEYLGLRGTKVSDVGLGHLEKLVHLKGLHLGATGVTGNGLRHLRAMRDLQRLWLHDTQVGDDATGHLERLESLRELYLRNTRLSDGAIEKLNAALPRCRISRNL